MYGPVPSATTTSLNPMPITDPTDIAGLVLWLKADSLALADGAEITSWPDSSAAGNDFVDSTIALVIGPQFQTNELNGLPVARFTIGGAPAWAGMEGASSLVLAHPYTIFYVARPRDALNATMRIVQSGSGNWLMGPYSGTWQWFSGGFATAGPSALDGNAIIHAVRADVASGTHFVWDLDSEDAPFSAARANPTAIGPMVLGFAGSSEGTNSDVAEVVVYDSELSDTDRDDVVAYLRLKWANVGPVPPPTPPAGGGSNRMGGTGAIRRPPRNR